MMTWFLGRVWLWWLIFACFSAHAVAIKDVSYQRLPGKAQITLTADGIADYQKLELSNPARLVVDIPAGIFHGKSSMPINEGSINQLRTGYFQNKNFRLVVDLNAPTPSKIYKKVTTFGGEQKIIIDILDNYNAPHAIPPQSNPTGLQLESLNDNKKTLDLPPPAPLPPRPQIATRPSIPPPAVANPPFRPKKQIIIAIDPGHGGKDPGAISRSTGLREKDVVLQIARRLKRKIDARPGFKAILTRDSDIFIPLQRRAQIARQNNADLFISIHADAVNSIEPSGSSVYILSTKGATSQLAKYLENSENAVDLRWGVDVSKYNDDIQKALLNIQQEATLDSSFLLAEKTLSELRNLGRVHKDNVERANFVVLRSPEIPSMLVETAFISNPDEARKLSTPSYQERLAEGISNGIFRYFSERLPQHMLLRQ